MSIKLLSAVWEKQIGPGLDRDVLMIYADHAGDDGRVAWPTLARVAWKVGASERHVRRVVRSLQNRGVLVAVESNKGEKRGVRYRVNLDALPDKAPLEAVAAPKASTTTQEAPKAAEAPRNANGTGDTHMSPQNETPQNGTGDTYMSPVGGTPICPPTGDTHMSPKPSENRHPNPQKPAAAGEGRRLDPLGHIFDRMAAKAAEDASNGVSPQRAALLTAARAILDKWSMPDYLRELALEFVDVFNVGPENATENQSGKWVGGLARLYAQKPTRAELEAVRDRALAARPTPLVITHPGAVVTTLVALKAERMTQTTKRETEAAGVKIKTNADGYEVATF